MLAPVHAQDVEDQRKTDEMARAQSLLQGLLQVIDR
jgi:hypothetical protein